MRVAVIHDWLYVLGGAERVLREILKCYPQADVFALFDVLKPEDRAQIGFERATTSFLQRVPFIKKYHQACLPLMPLAIEQFDLSGYDLVISSSFAVAMGVLTGPNQVHVAYVHSPMRYAWDQQDRYLRQANYQSGLKSVVVRLLLHRMRLWDVRTANGPDAIVANSAFVARRILKIYGRAAHVIHPPVVLGRKRPDVPRGSYFLTASRLVPYKNIDAVIQAFALMPDLQLVVAGNGPDAKRLKKLAGSNVVFPGFVPDEDLRDLMAGARAFVFAAEEDFGIVPVEALSEGTPVIALGRGGALETVVADAPNRSGLFFGTPSPEAIAAAVRSFVAQEHLFSRLVCRTQASRFSDQRFRAEFKAFVDSQIRRVAGRDMLSQTADGSSVDDPGLASSGDTTEAEAVLRQAALQRSHLKLGA